LSAALDGDPLSNLAISSGDVVSIEAQETLPIYVVGKVKNPGLYRLRKNTCGLLEALTLAGGAEPDAALSRVSVSSSGGATRTVDISSAVLGGKTVDNIRLSPGDLVILPESTLRIAVLGFVQEPGLYALKDSQKTTLSDALVLAKGLDNKRAGSSAITILRTTAEGQKKMVCDLRKFLKAGDLASNPDILPGDVIYVPETNKLDADVIIRAISSVGILLNPFIN
jgi:polysaccharide biosynthesis/export protein